MNAFRRKAKPPAKKSGLKQALQKTSRKKRFKHFLIFITLLVLFIVIGTGSRGTFKLLQISSDVNKLKKDIQALEDEKKQLEDILANIQLFDTTLTPSASMVIDNVFTHIKLFIGPEDPPKDPDEDCTSSYCDNGKGEPDFYEINESDIMSVLFQKTDANDIRCRTNRCNIAAHGRADDRPKE